LSIAAGSAPVDLREQFAELVPACGVEAFNPGDPAAKVGLEVGDSIVVLAGLTVSGSVVEDCFEPVVFGAANIGANVDDDAAYRLAAAGALGRGLGLVDREALCANDPGGDRLELVSAAVQPCRPGEREVIGVAGT
jgi:hypothetical protein